MGGKTYSEAGFLSLLFVKYVIRPVMYTVVQTFICPAIIAHYPPYNSHHHQQECPLTPIKSFFLPKTDNKWDNILAPQNSQVHERA